MNRVSNFKIALIVLLIFGLESCNIDDGNTLPIPETTIADIINADTELSSLVAALERVNLISTFDGTVKYTLLAPTNEAFNNYLGAQGYATINDVPIDELEQLLLNHVISGQIDTAPLINLHRNYLQTLASGPTSGTYISLYFDASSSIVFNGEVAVTEVDILAANGIIHKLSSVNELPTIATFVSSDINFESLETALDLAAPFSAVPDELEENGPYTLFAPTDHAFENLLASNNDWDSIDDIDEQHLASVIEHHVVAGNFTTSDISFGSMLPTLEGDEITFNNVDGNLEITDGTGNEGSIVGIPNLQASNGVLHGLINNVLIPDTQN